eukprot:TRINITY_DN87700_c0_g1_i1.p1 TRINITY_DN87700_c0_g1~~TRINITY_DN87700_c0_g1_i1.p1  ORF type:complete len:116 (-),score=9.00 TRINITY_DN87700_c0_g1_i1:28-375(-)
MKISIKFTFFTGACIGFLFFAIFIFYAVGFYYGSVLIEDGTNNALYGRPYSVGDVMVIFFGIMIGGFSMGQAAPCLDNFSKGKVAGFKVFKMLERQPEIVVDDNGKKLKNLKGHI